MKTVKTFKIAAIMMVMVMLMTVPCFAADPDFTSVVSPIVSLLNSLLKPLLLVVGAVGTLYCVILGVKFAKAEEPQDKEKAKQHLKNAIIGFVLIFILIVLLNGLMPMLSEWAGGYQKGLK